MHHTIFIWITPIVSMFIGWMTNYIAVKMIFRPLKPIKILGLTWIGLIPKRKSDLARKIGETVERELISHKDIHEAVNTPEFHEHLLDSVMKAIDVLISQKLGGNALVSLFLSGNVADQIRVSIKDELRTQLPEFMESMFEKLEQKIDFKEIIREKIEKFDLLKLEAIIYSIASRELKAIELLGGVLGFVVGLVQVMLMMI